MGWLRSVGSIKSQVSFAEQRLFYRPLLQKRLIFLSNLLTKATPQPISWKSVLLMYLKRTRHTRLLAAHFSNVNLCKCIGSVYAIVLYSSSWHTHAHTHTHTHTHAHARDHIFPLHKVLAIVLYTVNSRDIHNDFCTQYNCNTIARTLLHTIQ